MFQGFLVLITMTSKVKHVQVAWGDLNIIFHISLLRQSHVGQDTSLVIESDGLIMGRVVRYCCQIVTSVIETFNYLVLLTFSDSPSGRGSRWLSRMHDVQDTVRVQLLVSLESSLREVQRKLETGSTEHAQHSPLNHSGFPNALLVILRWFPVKFNMHVTSQILQFCCCINDNITF